MLGIEQGWGSLEIPAGVQQGIFQGDLTRWDGGRQWPQIFEWRVGNFKTYLPPSFKGRVDKDG